MSRGNTNNKKSRTGVKSNSKRRTFDRRNFKGKKPIKEAEPKEEVAATTKDTSSKDAVVGTENDFAWYNAYPQLAQDAGRLSFFNPLGTTFHLNTCGSESDYVAWVLQQQTAPGVMALNFSPCFAKSSDFGSQLNIAARNLYSHIRSTNSGAKNFDPADLMMYLLAMDSAYMYYAWMVRLYGMLKLYTPTNNYYPEGVFSAIDVEFADLQMNITQLRGYINMFGAKLGKLCVPSQLSLTKRHQWMCSNIFLDSNTDKAQSYIFTPDFYYVWSDNTNNQGTELVAAKAEKAGTAHLKFADLTNLGETIINGLMSSEDAAIISGDILRAYGPGSIYKIGELPETYQALPTYSEEVLTQIHNATLLKPLDTGKKGVTQSVDKQAIITTPTITVQWHDNKGEVDKLWTAKRIINLPTNVSDAATVFVATRLTTCLTLKSQEYDSKTKKHTAVLEVTCAGTEILTGITIVGNHRGYTFASRMDQTSKPVNVHTAVAPLVQEVLTDIQAFKSHPSCFIDFNGLYDDEMAKWMRLQELDNFTVVGHDELKRIHEVALLSELTLR